MGMAIHLIQNDSALSKTELSHKAKLISYKKSQNPLMEDYWTEHISFRSIPPASAAVGRIHIMLIRKRKAMECSRNTCRYLPKVECGMMECELYLCILSLLKWEHYSSPGISLYHELFSNHYNLMTGSIAGCHVFCCVFACFLSVLGGDCMPLMKRVRPTFVVRTPTEWFENENTNPVICSMKE